MAHRPRTAPCAPRRTLLLPSLLLSLLLCAAAPARAAADSTDAAAPPHPSPSYPPWLLSCEAAAAAAHSDAAAAAAARLPWRGTFGSLDELLHARPAVVALAHPGWAGVRHAAYAAGAPVLELAVIDTPDALLGVLHALGVRASPFLRALVFHGIFSGSIELAAWLACPGLAAAATPTSPRQPLRQLFVWHGNPSNIWHEDEAVHLVRLIEAAAPDRHMLAGVGLLKAGLRGALASTGMPLFSLSNVPRLPAWLPAEQLLRAAAPGGGGVARVGVFGAGAHKNVAAQALAACSLGPAVALFVTELPAPVLRYVSAACAHPVTVLGPLPHAAFVRALGTMDLVSYVSLTECSPMTVLEAAAAGVPALTSATSRVYDADPVLADALVVPRHDEADAIAAAMRAALQRRPHLARRLPALVGRLARVARAEWCAFTDGALAAACDGDAGAAGARPAASEPKAAAAAVVAKGLATAAAAAAPPARVAYVALELAPLGPGGAGTVTAALVVDALRAGTCVTVLSPLPQAQLDGWAAWARGAANVAGGDTAAHAAGGDTAAAHAAGSDAAANVTGDPAAAAACGLRVVGVYDTLHAAAAGDVDLPAGAWPPTSARELPAAHGAAPDAWSTAMWLQQAQALAVAAAAEWARAPFGVIELPDYGGVAFELLLQRQRAACAGAGAGGGASPPALPSSVTIAVRAHGTFQLIDQAAQSECGGEGGGAAPASTRWVYLQERYALATADAVLVPSRAVGELYARAYGLAPDALVVSPPPLRTIARVLMPGLAASRPAAVGASRSRDPLCAGGVVVFPGRFHVVKGTLEALAAAAQLLARHTALCVEFAGGDGDSPVDGSVSCGTMHECMHSLVPDATLHARIRLTPAFERSSPGGLPEIVARAAVLAFPSRLETWGALAREAALLARGSVPLVVSDTVGFRDGALFELGAVFVAGPHNLTAALEAALEVALEAALLGGRSEDASERWSDTDLALMLGGGDAHPPPSAHHMPPVGAGGPECDAGVSLIDAAMRQWPTNDAGPPAQPEERAGPSACWPVGALAQEAPTVTPTTISSSARRRLAGSTSTSASSSASPTALPTPSPSISASVTPTALPTPSRTPSISASVSPTALPTPSRTPSISTSVSPTALPTPWWPSMSASMTPTALPTPWWPSISASVTPSKQLSLSGSPTYLSPTFDVTGTKTQALSRSSAATRSHTAASSRSRSAASSHSRSAASSRSRSAASSRSRTAASSRSRSAASSRSHTAASSRSRSAASSRSPSRKRKLAV